MPDARPLCCAVLCCLLAWLPAVSSTPDLTADTASAAGDSPSATPVVAYAHIDGPIDQFQEDYFRRAIEQAKEVGATTLVTHITTDGGTLLNGRAMMQLALDQRDEGLRLVAFVDRHAISAGAMIAYGHDAIYISEAATIGDIGVIFQNAQGEMEYAPEKIETVVRGLLRTAARTRGWNAALLQKMTARNQALFEIRRSEERSEWDYVLEDDLPKYLADHPEVDRSDSGTVVKRWGEDRLLTFDGRQAVEHGMATALVSTLEGVLEAEGLSGARIERFEISEQERIARTLAGWAPLLAGLAVVMIMFELKTAGVGLFALLGGVFAMAFIFCQYYLDMVSNIEVIIIVLGGILVLVDLFTMAAGGILLLVGGAMVMGGLLMAFIPNDVGWSSEELGPALATALGDTAQTLGVMIIGFLLILRALPSNFVLNRIGSGDALTVNSGGATENHKESVVGRTATTRGDLRPGGRITLDDRIHSARSANGGRIPGDTQVRVVDVRLGEMIVEPLSDGDEAEAG